MKKIRKVCKTSGTAMSRMCSGLFKITSPWKENSNTKVSSRPMLVALSNLWTKVFSKYSVPLRFVTSTRVRIPPARGMTTNKMTDKISVSHGTDTLETPSRNFTIGTKATRIIKSLVATCTTV